MSIFQLLEDFFGAKYKKDLETKSSELISCNSLLTASNIHINTLLDSQKSLTDQVYAKDLYIKTLEADNLQSKIDLNKANDQISQLSTDLMKKSDDNFKLLPPATQNILLAYLNKYQKSDILYSGRYFGANKESYAADVKIYGLEGQNDPAIIKRVKDANAFVFDIMNQMNIPFHKACDIAVMRISAAFKCNYVYDSDSWGSGEFWMFASEREAMGKGDCDDHMVWRYVACRIAGIPKEMLRMVAGLTFSGEGHATNFYFASDLKWHHINSTSDFGNASNVLNLPLTSDSRDLLNIKEVWFAFTESDSWHQLSTSAVESFNNTKNDKLKNFIFVSKL